MSVTYEPYRALYIHIPFCKNRCAYCDFATQACSFDSSEIDEYIAYLENELRESARLGELDHIETIYIGGGTPTFIGPSRLARLLATIAEVVDISRIKEFSMEANPESLTKEILEVATQAGINRISIGVQSFHDKTLQLLNRIHSAQQARDAILLAQSYLENISVDIMCGISGQSPEEFLDDIQQAVDLGITHISVYPLTIEEGTPFETLVEQGKMEDINPDLQAMMMAMAPNVLEAAGFSRYEVASYAKPNFECVHNSAYWTGVSYKGIGQSAVSMKQHEASRERIQDGTVVEVLNRRQMVAEDMMMKLRMARGITENELRESAVLLPAMLDVFHDLEEKGLIVREGNRYKPTLGGWLLGNELYGRIYELAP